MMKRHRNYLGMWMLTATAFLIFAVASAFEPLRVGDYTLHSAGFAKAVLPKQVTETQDSVHLQPANDSIASPETQFPVPLDTAAQRILFIGDSMLEGLSPRLAAYCTHNGHKLYSVIWYSSTSKVWGESDKLAAYIRSIRPTYVFISLGANELFVTDIISKRRDCVRKIIADIGNIPYLWIGPPNWKPDTGINALIGEETKEGTFFVSNGMTFDRAKDGAHPTRTSAALWMDSVARWMPGHCLHPIRMEKPTVSSGRPAKIFVHQPSEK